MKKYLFRQWRGDALSQRFIQHEVNLIVSKRLLELAGLRFLVNPYVLDAADLGEVLPVLLADVVGEG